MSPPTWPRVTGRIRAASQFTQIVGEPKIEFGSQYYFWFAQDDWRVRPNFKLSFGVRYELYDIPDARPMRRSRFRKSSTATRTTSRRAWGCPTASAVRATVVRASAVFYDAPGLAFYQNAIQNNGDPLTRTFTCARPTPARRHSRTQ